MHVKQVHNLTGVQVECRHTLLQMKHNNVNCTPNMEADGLYQFLYSLYKKMALRRLEIMI